MPAKSKPTLPSFASIREVKDPPVRRSFSARGVCQSSEAEFHLVMCSGSLHSFQTFSTGALTFVLTVIVFSLFIFFVSYVLSRLFFVSFVLFLPLCNLCELCVKPAADTWLPGLRDKSSRKARKDRRGESVTSS